MKERKGYSNFMSTTELAALWHKSPRTLENGRVQSIGPAYTKIGGTVLYERDVIEDYEKQSKSK